VDANEYKKVGCEHNKVSANVHRYGSKLGRMRTKACQNKSIGCYIAADPPYNSHSINSGVSGYQWEPL